MDRVKRIWYLSPMRAAKVQASLRIRAVSPEPSLLAHTSSESRGTFRQKTRSLAPLNGWACAVEICHDGMLEDTNWLDGAHILSGRGRVSHLLIRSTLQFCKTPFFSLFCFFWSAPPPLSDTICFRISCDIMYILFTNLQSIMNKKQIMLHTYKHPHTYKHT